MSAIHAVRLTHHRADLIIDALRAAAEEAEVLDMPLSDELTEIADDLLGVFDAQHRGESAAAVHALHVFTADGDICSCGADWPCAEEGEPIS